MKLKALAKQPELVKVSIDDDEIVKEYGEPLDFYIMDRQPMETFLKFATSGGQDVETMSALMKDMILDEDGNKVIDNGYLLPSKILVAAFTKLASQLGK